MITFILGVFAGCVLGISVMAILAVDKGDDDEA